MFCFNYSYLMQLFKNQLRSTCKKALLCPRHETRQTTWDLRPNTFEHWGRYQALVEVEELTLDIGFSVIRISATTSSDEQLLVSSWISSPKKISLLADTEGEGVKGIVDDGETETSTKHSRKRILVTKHNLVPFMMIFFIILINNKSINTFRCCGRSFSR